MIGKVSQLHHRNGDRHRQDLRLPAHHLRTRQALRLPQVHRRRPQHRHLRGRDQELRDHPQPLPRPLRQRDRQPHPLRRRAGSANLRAFATSTFIEILVMTLDVLQHARPTSSSKPPSNCPASACPTSTSRRPAPSSSWTNPRTWRAPRSKEALRTLHPLFALRYSATHRESPNLVYRLTPFEAFRNLVKQIQVDGVTERENFNQPFLALEAVVTARARSLSGQGTDVSCRKGMHPGKR